MSQNTKASLLRAPGEVRNMIYKAMIEDLPDERSWLVVLSLAGVNKQLRQEVFSYYFTHAAINMASTLDLDELEILLDTVPNQLGWQVITKVGFPDFLETALSRARADQLMLFCQTATHLQELTFNIRLEHMSINRNNAPNMVQAFAQDHALDQLHTLPHLKRVEFLCTYYDGDVDQMLAPNSYYDLFFDLEVWVLQELFQGHRVVDVKEIPIDTPANALSVFAWDIVRV